jgi:integrin-linked kinase-associated serine/threonine phosphatase 2C
MTKELGENVRYFAVYDGHGVKGRDAAEGLRKEIRRRLISDRSKISKFIKKESVEKYFTNAFKSIQKKLTNTNDYELSGTCAVCVLIIEPKLYVINLGDSRAVLGAINKKSGKKIAIEMSIDHKPSRQDETQRIVKSGGEVSDKLAGAIRVFRKNDDVPGLAVSRSIGDIVAHECGVIAEPEVIERDLEAEDAFIVIGSDGVWDAMSSTEVVGFIFQKMELKKETTAIALAEECRHRWEILNLYKTKYINEVNSSKESNNEGTQKNKGDQQNIADIDDITAVIHFINYE